MRLNAWLLVRLPKTMLDGIRLLALVVWEQLRESSVLRPLADQPASSLEHCRGILCEVSL